MSNLISGKDVVLALLEGKDLLWRKKEWDDDEKETVFKSMWNIEELLTGKAIGGDVVEFYLKPRTITLNGVEVPRPIEITNGMASPKWECLKIGDDTYWFKTKEEIKQVVSALREVFK